MQRKYIAHNSLLPFYLAWQLEPGSARYHLNFSYLLKSREAVNQLIDSLQKLVRLKAYLRQTFSLENENLMVSLHEKLPPEIIDYACTVADFYKLEQILIKTPHDLNKKSLVKLYVIKLCNGDDHIVLFNIHHILMDGSTLDRFIGDLNRLLAGERLEAESIDDYLAKLNQEKPLQEKNSDDTVANYLSEVNRISEEINFPVGGNHKEALHYVSVFPSELFEKISVF